MDPFSGFHIGAYYTHPESRGYVHIGSPDPNQPPRMQANYLDHPGDRAASTRAMQLVRRIASQPALQSVIVREVRPGPQRLIRRRIPGVRAEHRPDRLGIRSARVGWAPARIAVVDAGLRVHGMAGLRVADASVMPFHASSNTNVPAMVIGEKAADLILRSL